jgi:hypothetical protein
MLSAHPCPENVGTEGSMQMKDREAEKNRHRARYYSMSPEQVETLRQNKRKYYLKRKLCLLAIFKHVLH